MTGNGAPRVVLAPPGPWDFLAAAIVEGGGHVVDIDEAEALVWCDPFDRDGLAAVLDQHPDVGWIQLPFAGVEPLVDLIDHRRTWTCGKGVYAEPCAELVLTLMLAGMRGLSTYSRSDTWQPPQGRNLLGARVTIFGGGGITESLVRLLQPFDCHITVVRNRVSDMPGVDDVLSADRVPDALAGADVVVLALALTPETAGLISAEELAMMEPHAWLVNVARGRHVVTGDLVEALRNSEIGGACLDATDPEPLPDGHPLWSLPNCIITPHVANTPEMAEPLLAAWVTENVRRYARGEELLGPVEPSLGY